MFYYINGDLVHKGENFAVLDVGGLGYRVYTSASCLQSLTQLNIKVKMYTYTHLREDVMDLYGFTTQEELTMFGYLISVSKVGPKVALGILSTIAPSKFALAVITNDVKVITKAPGVGPKMAQRIILELKDKLQNIDMLPDIDGGIEIADDNQGEAISALTVLGYTPQEARAVVMKLDVDLGVEDLIKEGLKKLMK